MVSACCAPPPRSADRKSTTSAQPTNRATFPVRYEINGMCMLRTPPPVRRPQIYNVRSAHQPCDLPRQVRINGICMLRTTPPVRRRAYRRCVEWNEGMCVEYY